MGFLNRFKLLFKNFESASGLRSAVETPDDLWFWMSHHLQYVSDQKQWGLIDKWETPDEVVRNKKADCDGWAVLAKEVLTQMGYDARIVVVKFPKKNRKFGMHAMCAYDSYKTWILMGSDGHWKTEALDLTGVPGFFKIREKFLGDRILYAYEADAGGKKSTVLVERKR